MAYLRKLPGEGKAERVTLEDIVDIAHRGDEGRLRDTIRIVRELLVEERRRDKGLRINGSLAYIPKEGDAIIIGDLHGDEESLLKILRKTNFVDRVGRGEKLKLIFLGDYIDRGPNQLEVLNIAFELKRNFSENVVLLKGNHEVLPPSENAPSGADFLKTFLNRYGNAALYMYKGLYELLMGLPIAAKSENGILFVHGGVSEKVKGDISIIYVENDVERDLLWSDPRGIEGSRWNDERGLGVQFGKDVLDEVLKSMGCVVLIRSHEPLEADMVEMFEGKLLTIFSSERYRKIENRELKIGYGCVSLEKKIDNVSGILRDI